MAAHSGPGARRTPASSGSSAKRVPDLSWFAAEPEKAPTFAQAARRWQASRVDLADSTRLQHRIQLDKLLPLIGTRLVDALTAQDFIDAVADLHAAGTARETIRKTLGAGAMTLDHAGVAPNPARDRSIKLPFEEPEEINPPTAEQVEAVFRLLPSKHRLPLLWLDWSGARVSAIDLTLVGDYDEPRRRVRLRASTTKTRKALWIEAHPDLADAIERRLGSCEDRDHEARLFAESGAEALRTAIAKACRATGIPLWSPHDLRPPSNLAPAPARRALGADRRVRRAARPHRDREHLHARPLRRDRGRLRKAARMRAGRHGGCGPRCGPRRRKAPICAVVLDQPAKREP
jgi:integrase